MPVPILRSSAVQKQIGQMKKLFGLWPKSKRRDLVNRERNPVRDDSKLGVPDFLSQTRGVRGKHVTRRQFVLNRHFTEILSDVLANNFKSEIEQLGINITSIETKAWNKGVRIFYYQDEPFNEETHKSLKALVVHMRAAIGERQLLGRVPYVNFVYDQSVLVERQLNEAVAGIKLEDKGPDVDVAPEGPSQLYVSKDLGSQEQALISRRFSAPRDMNNCMLGVDYPKFYDEVALQLAKGRGESSRIVSPTNALISGKPLFKGPPEDEGELDPVTRLLRMQTFLVRQKKKMEHQSRMRRKDEILARESVQWVKDDAPEDVASIKVTRDLQHEADQYYYQDDNNSDANSSQKTSGAKSSTG